jgi:hypothetical protein
MVLRRGRRRRLRRAASRVDRTDVLGGVALLLAGTVAGGEVAKVWRRTPAELPAEALGQTLDVAVAGYRGGTRREHALLNLLGAFTATWGAARLSAHAIHARPRVGPFRNVVLRGRHIHHFVPGILLAFGAGGAAILTRREELEPWLALPFGAGVALTLDESALLLQLDDVYWTEEGVVSVQITFTTLAILSALLLGLRVLRRGEAEVLPGGDEAQAAAAAAITPSTPSRTPSPHST